MKQERQGALLFETVFNYTHFRVLKNLTKVESIDVMEMNTVAETEFILRAEYGLNIYDDEVALTLHYHANVFSREQIDAIGKYYLKTLQLMSKNPLDRYEHQSLLSEKEQEQLLEKFNETETDYPDNRCFHELFQDQAQRTPGATAVICENEELSYNRLNLETNRLARALVNRGIKREEVTAVIMERSIELLFAILAIFKAGGTYLPMDPNHPAERTETILSQSNCRLLLTDRLIGLPAENHRDVFVIDSLIQSESDSSNLPSRAAPQDLAYVIYTSGSTGMPKGAMIEHRGMLNHLYAKINQLELTHTDSIVQNATQCFDISIWQFLSALTVGGQTVIYPHNLVMEPKRFISR